MTARAATVAPRFALPGPCRDVARLGSGHIHDTWELRCSGPSGVVRAVLQRLNDRVFADPAALMDNLVRITDHLRRSFESEGLDPKRRCPTLIPDREGRAFHVDEEGRTWRCFRFLEGTRALDAVHSPRQAREAARAFGDFARRLADLPAPPLAVTIPDFHDRGRRLDRLAAAAEVDACGRAGAVATEIERASRWFETLEGQLAACGADSAPRRIVHHDCKVNNVLLDAADDRALCVIDLDTAMEGQVLSDFGELVRTTTCRAPEDELHLAAMRFEPELFEALARGYLEGSGDLLGEAEIRGLVWAGPALTLMNAIRFLTDYLEGDAYFRVARESHNLDRCRAQLRLVELLYEHRELADRVVGGAARSGIR